MRVTFWGGLAVAAAVLATPVFADTIVGSAYTGSTSAIFAGNYSGYGLTVGETFTAPNNSDVYLNSFTFYIPETGNSMNYLFSVYAWTGSATTGPALFTQGFVAPTGFNNTASPLVVTATPIGLATTFGSAYVALLTIATTPSSDGIYFGANLSDTYAGGYLLTSDNTGTLFPSSTWDLAFQADFSSSSSATPEPGTMAFAAAGVLWMAWRGRRLGRREVR
jgi:hypothetical protein